MGTNSVGTVLSKQRTTHPHGDETIKKLDLEIKGAPQFFDK